jgi:hypothetical protein
MHFVKFSFTDAAENMDILIQDVSALMLLAKIYRGAMAPFQKKMEAMLKARTYQLM